MKWENVTRADLNTAITSVKSGYAPQAAKNLIEYFHERMSNDEYYDKDMLHLLMAHVFSQIVEHQATTDQAFGLKRKRGMRTHTNTEARDLQATACVILLIRRGDTWENAVFDTTELLFPDGNTSGRVIERAYSSYRLALEAFPDEILAQLLEPYAVPSYRPI